MPRLRATAADLSPAVAAALADPQPGRPGVVDAGGTAWPTLSWGDVEQPPVLLIHGVTSNAGIWWRTAPALAASDRYVVAVDMPGHGQTARGQRSHRLGDTATELAGFIRAAGLDRPDLAVVGHSWGAMVTANLPAAGLAPATIVLLDPAVLTLDELRALTEEPTERTYATLEAAVATVRRANPGWSAGDVDAKARALTEFNPEFVLAVLTQNGPWDAGMAVLRVPAAAATKTWLIRGEWKTGGLIPDSNVPGIEAQLGAERVITIIDGPHSPQRTHPEATLVAILRALA
jgi:pimeloyl-ACP methyl ester carboxylesterase